MLHFNAQCLISDLSLNKFISSWFLLYEILKREPKEMSFRVLLPKQNKYNKYRLIRIINT